MDGDEKIYPEFFRTELKQPCGFVKHMFALGVETNFEKIKGLGLKPILLAGIMFIWLVVFGACTARFIV